MSIAVLPSQFVAVIAARRHQVVEDLGEITFKSRFKLDRTDSSGTTDVEDVGDAGVQATPLDDGIDRGGDVVHGAVAAGVNRESFLVGH